MRKTGAGVSEEDLRKYTLYSALEIGRILNGMKDERQMVRMRFAESQQEAVTAVLAVDAARKRFVVDALSDARQQSLAERSPRLFFEGRHNRIAISFTTGAARQVVFEGAPALEVGFPDQLTRLQRRESFRVFVRDSVVEAPVKGEVLTFSIRDVSQSGCCLVDPDKRLQDQVGQTLSGCTLALAGVQELEVALEVCRSYDVATPAGQQQRRVGCRFASLEAAKAALIQRFVMQVERKNRELLG